MRTKEILLSLVLLFFGAATVQAQTYERRNVLISPGVNLAAHNYYPGVGFGVPVVLNVDILVHEYVSVGPFVSVSSRKYSSDQRYLGVDFGARGSFHFWSFIDDRVDADLKSEIFDLYGVVHAGYAVSNYDKLDGRGNQSASRFIAGPMLGARWYFAPNVALYAEGGLGASGLLSAGVTFRL